MEGCTLRMATPADAAALRAIYVPYVEETCISFEYAAPTVDEFRGRIAQVLEKFPYILCEKDGVVLGYAYASPYRVRAAYAWSVEVSVYLSPAGQGRGVGAALYTAMFKLLKAQGVRMVFACVSGSNVRSNMFHKRMGFEAIGICKGAGYKRGQWLDVVSYQKAINPLVNEPSRVLRPDELPPEEVEAILLGE